MIPKILKLFIFILVSLSLSLLVIKFYNGVKIVLSPYLEPEAFAQNKNSSDYTQTTPALIPTQEHPPQKIRIPTLNLELSIKAAVIENGQWQLFTDHVSWLSASATPGKGNVILYAHNYPELFGKLNKLSAGEIIEVEQYSQWKQYIVSQVSQVKPNNVDSVISTDNRLTLYTCDGAFDEKRLIVVAIPQS